MFVATFAIFISSHVQIAVIATPVVLLIPASTVFVLRVIEVTVVASPGIFTISTFTILVFWVEPPESLLVS